MPICFLSILDPHFVTDIHTSHERERRIALESNKFQDAKLRSLDLLSEAIFQIHIRSSPDFEAGSNLDSSK